MSTSIAKLVAIIMFMGLVGHAQASTSWGTYKNKRFGFELTYPDTYTHNKFLSNESGHTFTSPDGLAQIASYGMLDNRWYGAELYLKKVIQATGRASGEFAPFLYPKSLSGDAYQGIIDTAAGKYWIALYGERGDHFFYEYYTFSCADKVVSVLSFTYAIEAKKLYEPLTDKLVRRFHSGSGSSTPRHCL